MDKRSDIKQLFEEYKGCLRCPDLCTRRTKVVFGEGGINANLMIIGEPPGAYEDKVGFPLRGEAGSLLDEIFTPLGISRQYDVYITSMVLCRPSYDEDTDEGIKRKPRSPTRDELLACNPRLMQEIYIVDPKIILLLGERAATLVTRNTITKASDTVHYLEVPGKSIAKTLRYPAVVSWDPGKVARGSMVENPGTQLTQLKEAVSVAWSAAMSAKEFSKELTHESK